MPIRPATYADLVPAAKCLAAAFKDEAMFGIYMHPHRTQYPTDMYLQFLTMIRTAYFSGPDNNHVFVSYQTSPETSTETITGFAHWRRLRASPKPQTWSRNLLTTLVHLYNHLEAQIYPNRASEPSRTAILSRLGPFAKPFYRGSRAEVYDLALLGVDPGFGGQGFGRELVEWGFERGKKEGVGCAVVASDGKEGFYRSCGFERVVGNVRDFGGMENPCNENDIPGGAVLFWDNGREVEVSEGEGEGEGKG